MTDHHFDRFVAAAVIAAVTALSPLAPAWAAGEAMADRSSDQTEPLADKINKYNERHNESPAIAHDRDHAQRDDGADTGMTDPSQASSMGQRVDRYNQSSEPDRSGAALPEQQPPGAADNSGDYGNPEAEGLGHRIDRYNQQNERSGAVQK
ncbi:hypothetical protein [Salinisphaera sp. T31B1]|uniref:hypothetical protein n=1 Tax=Salinisphaera sp. T31B1 TaxID=727963 RepID=UPI00333FB3C8